MYIRLKHRLSELALEAVRKPGEAGFSAWLAAYSSLDARGRAVPFEAVRAKTETLANAAGWAVDRGDLARAGILWQGRGRVALPRAARPHARYFRAQALRMYRAALYLVHHPSHSELPDPLYRGLVLFDFGLFFSTHEYFEGVWRQTSGQDRLFYHGLIQLGAAFYHHEKPNRHGAVTLLKRALEKLAPYRPRHLGLDVESLTQTLHPWERRFARGEDAPYPVFAIGDRRPAVSP